MPADEKFKICYEDLQSGDAIPLYGVGHVRSPKLREMRPTEGCGWGLYSTYIYYLKISTASLIQNLKIQSPPESAGVFDYVVYLPTLHELYEEAFNFFITEQVIFDETHGCFVVIEGPSDVNGEPKLAGMITGENFDKVRAAILLLNYISLEQADVGVRHSSKSSEDAWNRAQKFLAEQQPTEQQDDKTMALGNLISKLCALHPSINYLNVYDLTVFQFYDTFFQSSYLRSISFSEAVVSNHGSKEFDYSNWLNPLKNY